MLLTQLSDSWPWQHGLLIHVLLFLCHPYSILILYLNSIFDISIFVLLMLMIELILTYIV